MKKQLEHFTPRDLTTGKRRPKTSEANKRRYQNPVYLAQAQARMRKLKSPGRPVGLSFNGMRTAEATRLVGIAKAEAKVIMATLAAKGIITPEDDPRATEALEAAVVTMRSPQNQGLKLAAAKLILEYTKSKPAAKSEVSINAAEAWLAEVAVDASKPEETEGDAEAPSE